MGLFSKLAFWKKDDLDFDELVSKDMHDPNLSGMPKDDLGLPGESEFQHDPLGPQDPLASAPTLRPSADREHPLQQLSSQQNYSSYAQPQRNTDLELVNSKLDTIKAMLNSMDQRLSRIERSQFGESKEKNLW